MKYYNYCVSQVKDFKEKGYNYQWFDDLVVQYTSQLMKDETEEFYAAVAKRINKGPPIVMYGYERPSGAESSIYVVSNMWNNHSQDFIKQQIYNGVICEVEKFMNPPPQPTEREQLRNALLREAAKEMLQAKRQEEEEERLMAIAQYNNNMTPDIGYGAGVQNRNGRYYYNCQMK